MGHGLPPTRSDLLMIPQVHCENPRRVCSLGRTVESLQGVGQEEDPARRTAGETELGSLGTSLSVSSEITFPLLVWAQLQAYTLANGILEAS